MTVLAEGTRSPGQEGTAQEEETGGHSGRKDRAEMVDALFVPLDFLEVYKHHLRRLGFYSFFTKSLQVSQMMTKQDQVNLPGTLLASTWHENTAGTHRIVMEHVRGHHVGVGPVSWEFAEEKEMWGKPASWHGPGVLNGTEKLKE